MDMLRVVWRVVPSRRKGGEGIGRDGKEAKEEKKGMEKE